MGWIIGMILAIVVCGIAFSIGRTMQRSGKRRVDSNNAEDDTTSRRSRSYDENAESKLFVGIWVKRGAIIAFVLWVGIWTLFATLKQVPAGNVGVVYQFGAIVSQRSEGLQVIAPWQSLDEESIQVQRQTFDNITAFSSENQDVFVKATINYSVSPDAVQKLRREVGSDWFDRLIEPRVNNFLKEETVKYSIVEITPQRETIRLAV